MSLCQETVFHFIINFKWLLVLCLESLRVPSYWNLWTKPWKKAFLIEEHTSILHLFRSVFRKIETQVLCPSMYWALQWNAWNQQRHHSKGTPLKSLQRLKFMARVVSILPPLKPTCVNTNTVSKSCFLSVGARYWCLDQGDTVRVEKVL